MQKAQGLWQYVVNEKAVGIAKNSYLALKLAAPLGSPKPEGWYLVLASWFQTVCAR